MVFQGSSAIPLFAAQQRCTCNSHSGWSCISDLGLGLLRSQKKNGPSKSPKKKTGNQKHRNLCCVVMCVCVYIYNFRTEKIITEGLKKENLEKKWELCGLKYPNLKPLVKRSMKMLKIHPSSTWINSQRRSWRQPWPVQWILAGSSYLHENTGKKSQETNWMVGIKGLLF